jgi:type VI secretion system secreted protein Hcp
MAETVHLSLTLDGQAIQGESTQTSLGRGNTIELLSFEYAVQKDGDAKVPGDFKMVSRLDKAFPLIAHGLSANQVAAGTFKFFRPNPNGDGTTEQFFTITAASGKITSYDLWVPATNVPASATQPPLVQYTMSFEQVTLTYTNGAVTQQDDWTTG